MRLARRLTLFVLLASPLAATGCAQGIGDRCQVASDCDDGLICVLSGATPQGGGTCQAPNTPDGSAVIDMTTPGNQPDINPNSDL